MGLGLRRVVIATTGARLRAQRGTMYLMVCLTILPISLALYGGVLLYLDATVRQTNVEEHRLRAELMAESALAYYSASGLEDSKNDGSAKPSVFEFDSGASFEVEAVGEGDNPTKIVCRGVAVAMHAKVKRIRYANEIILAVPPRPSSGEAPRIRIVRRSRSAVPLPDLALPVGSPR